MWRIGYLTTLKHLVNEYIGYCKQRKSQNTVDAYQSDLLQFLSFVETDGVSSPDKVGARNINRFLASLPEKNSSLNRKRNCLSSFFKYLVNNGLLLENPVKKVERFKIPKRKPDYLTEEEVEHIRLGCMQNSLHLAIIDFMLATGVRESELCDLKISDVDIEGSQARVVGKGDKERFVLIGAQSIDSLNKYLSARSDSNPHLFLNKGDPLTPSRIYYMIRKMGKVFLGRNIHPHLFRHTCATNLVNKGMSMVEAQTLLGHEDIQTTLLYAHPTKDIKKHYHEAMK
jgi:integrase/recombinase XerC